MSNLKLLLVILSRIKNVSLVISTLFIVYLLLHRQPTQIPSTLPYTIAISNDVASPTTVKHLLFSIASSSTSLPARKPYINLWYTPNSTRAFVFLDRLIPPDPTLPPIIVSGDTSNFPYTCKSGLRSAIRVARVVKEAVDLNEAGVRWFVFGDDDTVFFSENVAKVLSKYDHDKWYYVGSNSESFEQNQYFWFDMAFGGGGFAISSSLARVLAKVLDSCLMRYPHLYGSDGRIFSCLAELGVGLTHEKGFHQVDVRGDISGILSSHSLSPLLSLHHFAVIDPIFPGKSKTEALKHLFKATNMDSLRILQKSVCYDPSKSFTLSLSWGYSVQIFEGNQLLPDILPVQRTFRSWRRSRNESNWHYMFNLKDYPRDRCKRPLTFFLEDVKEGIYTTYLRNDLRNCAHHKSIRSLERVEVVSQKLVMDVEQVKAPRRQCCDIISSDDKTLSVNVRQCGSDELVSMNS